jgi:hypothetical protein
MKGFGPELLHDLAPAAQPHVREKLSACRVLMLSVRQQPAPWSCWQLKMKELDW